MDSLVPFRVNKIKFFYIPTQSFTPGFPSTENENVISEVLKKVSNRLENATKGAQSQFNYNLISQFEGIVKGRSKPGETKVLS